MKPFRTETDSMGEVPVPADALYGAQTARALEDFPISGLRLPREFLRALGLIKKHAAGTNAVLGLLPEEVSGAIQQAAQEVIDGKLDPHFVVDILQTGSGTSTNMNANEVIANRASEILGGQRGDKRVHPNGRRGLRDLPTSTPRVLSIPPECSGYPCLTEYEDHPPLSQPQSPGHLAPPGGGTTPTPA